MSFFDVTPDDRDGGPFDPGAWQEWLATTDKIESGLPPRDG